MKLTIISPSEKKEYNVLWIEGHSTSGSFILQPQHAPLIARLAPEKPLVFATTHDVIETVVVHDGVLQHTHNNTFVILTS